MNAYTLAQMAAEVEAVKKQKRKGKNKGRADEARHGYGPHNYRAETPPQWEIVTRRSEMPVNSLVLKESREGQTGLKVNGQYFNNGRVRLAIKPRPYNVAENEVLIPLR